MGISSARNFTVQNNVLVGNTSFIGSTGPKCHPANTTPSSQPFVAQMDNITQSSIQSNFVNVTDAGSLVCVVPPSGGSLWPFGESHAPGTPPPVPGVTSPAPATHQGMNTATKVGIAIGVISGTLIIAILSWFIRKRLLARHDPNRQMAWISARTGYRRPNESSD